MVAEGDPTELPAAAGPTVEPLAAAQLSPGAVLECRLAPGEVHAFQLSVEQGDYVEIEVEQQGVDVVVRLLDPQRKSLLESDLPIADLGLERLVAIAEQTGAYWVEIKAWEHENSEGTYGFTFISRPAVASDRPQAQAAASYSAAEQMALNGNPEAALVLHSRALDLWRLAEDERWQAETIDRMGDVRRVLRQWRLSKSDHEESAALFGYLGETRLEAISLNDLATACWNLGELDTAYQHQSRALELRRQVGDRRGIALALQGMAEIYKVRGETQQALDNFSEALGLLDRPEDRRYRGTTLHNLGTLYGRTGKRALARDHLLQAEEIFAVLGMSLEQALSLSQLGQLAFERGDEGEALANLSHALELFGPVRNRSSRAVVLRRIGSVHQARGETQEALHNYLAALKLLRDEESPRTRASVLTRLGFLHGEIGDVDAALGDHREALALYEKVGDQAGRAESLLGIAVSERRHNDQEAARLASRRALAIVETLRLEPLSEDLRFSYFSTAQHFFDFYIDLLMELRSVDAAAADEALMVSERARARSLLDLLGEAYADIRSDAAPELLADELALQRQLNGASVELMDHGTIGEGQRRAMRRIVARLDSVRAEIRRQSPRYAALTQPQPLDTRRIQQQVLDPETVLLEYKLGHERSFLWLVEQDSSFAFELAARDEIERSVRRVHGLLSKGDREESEVLIRGLLCDLSGKLLGPVAGRLGHKRLAIVAEGALQYLPFAALPDPDSSEACAQAQPLLIRHEIVFLPSASILAVLRRERESLRPPSEVVAVMADPVFSSDDERVDQQVPPEPSDATREQRAEAGPPRYRRLLHSREEAESILRLAPPGLGLLALDFDASKDVVLEGGLADYRIVHFATHGMLNAQPELSGIVLSLVDRHGREVDGFLRAHELYNLSLPAELVVLGACETALGKDVEGEGLVGLTRGFMYAGAARVMVSLWRVSDRGTSELMQAFYGALLDRRESPSAALRTAQLSLRQAKPHPFFWAAFVLQGDWQATSFR